MFPHVESSNKTDSDEAAKLSRRNFGEAGRRINIEETTGTYYTESDSFFAFYIDWIVIAGEV